MMAMFLEDEVTNVSQDAEDNLYTPKPVGRRNSGRNRTFQRIPTIVRSDVGDT